ncbi:MAG: PEGA domain-containing protein [Gammaproteobacteria bacterium]
MSKQTEKSDSSPHKELIEPIEIDFAEANATSRINIKQLIKSLYIIAAIMLIFVLWFVISAKTVVIDISPTPDELKLSEGSLSLQLKDRFLAQPGGYSLSASKDGYYPLKETINVGMLASYTFKRTLKKKPGYISITLDSPPLARVYIDNRYVGVTPLHDIELTPGTHTIELQRYRYQPLWSELQVEGAQQKQKFSFAMLPDWSLVSFDSVPSAAQVWLDGEKHGSTPLQLEVNAGRHHLELVHPDYEAYISDFVVLPNQPLDLGAIELGRDPSHLIVKSTPAGASVFVNEQERGSTPLTMTLSPNVDYKLRFAKSGYRELSRSVRVKAGESKSIDVGLQAILASIHLEVEPKTAMIIVNGKLQGHGDQTFALTTANHTIEVKESGYVTQVMNVNPQANQPINKKITLQLRENTVATFPNQYTNSQGQQLRLITPGQFKMGSSRREQGRRANEVLREVKLTRQFYIGVKEVSNQEFSRFDIKHDSGNFNGVDLSVAQQPVANVTWEQAALYCNWLSKLEDLPVSYREHKGKVIAANPLLTGYRLVTEAEWAWVARAQTNGELLRYSWGEQYPPVEIAGNYADQQTRKIIGFTIPNYDDGFSGPAPVGSFDANHQGIFDMGGNVAEWMHDFYTIYSASTAQAFIDPTGPNQGKHHVVRGSSWLRGTLSNTRLAYRDYREKPHAEIGFRIARYVEE